MSDLSPQSGPKRTLIRSLSDAHKRSRNGESPATFRLIWRGEAPQMNDAQSTTDPQPDPAPFKVHLLTRAGRVVRARSEAVRAFSAKDEAVRFAGRQLGGHYAVYHKHKKIWPAS